VCQKGVGRAKTIVSYARERGENKRPKYVYGNDIEGNRQYFLWDVERKIVVGWGKLCTNKREMGSWFKKKGKENKRRHVAANRSPFRGCQ